MSRALETLARLQRAQIDEARNALAGIVAARTMLSDRDKALMAEVAAEQIDAARDQAGVAAYGAYAPRVAQERQMLAREDARLARDEEVLRERVREAFVELKKIELLIATQAERERAAQNARELAALDEAAAMRAARRT
ncbi:MAG: flagellar FliJ family protein [Hyphomonadaceae bacterium]|nr:flagellar FliJ family protein [Hyphomonadaceae bacterium]